MDTEPGRRDSTVVVAVLASIAVAVASMVWAVNRNVDPQTVAASEGAVRGISADQPSPLPSAGESMGTDPDPASLPTGQGPGPSGGSAGGPAGPSGTERSTGQPAPDPSSKDTSDGRARHAGQIPVGPGTPGVTDTVVRLGFQTADLAALNAAATALGAQGEVADASVDLKDVVRAVVAYVNKRGGIAGRQIEPIFHEVDLSGQATPEGRARDAQRACSTFTEDNEVFSFSDVSAWTEDNITQCARDAGVVMTQVMPLGAVVGRERAAELRPFFYSTSRLMADAHDYNLVEHTVARGFLPADAKVGLLLDDAPSSQAAGQRALKPALAARGIEVVAEATYPDVIESPWDTYVLQFRRAGVTHVLFGASSFGSWPLQMMMRSADNQKWYPQYRGTSELAGASQTGQSPLDQLANVKIVGWSANADTGPTSPTNEPGPGRARCKEAVTEAGYDESLGDTAAIYCEYVFLLWDAMGRASEFSARGLEAALPGTEYQSQYNLGGTRFRQGWPDGVAALRPAEYAADCECFVYTGAPAPVQDDAVRG